MDESIENSLSYYELLKRPNITYKDIKKFSDKLDYTDEVLEETEKSPNNESSSSEN